MSIYNYDKMISYAEMVYENNRKFNLTGHKGQDEIINDLIDGTLQDLIPENVPRGTLFADIGTGSGIPGVVIALGNPEVRGVLIDSSAKKTEFIREVCRQLDIRNIEVVCSRAEVYARNVRSKFDFCFTRAFGPVYYSIEFGMCLLKKCGSLNIFSKRTFTDLSADLVRHLESCGGALPDKSSVSLFSSENRGICFLKTSETPEKYPRRFPVIKREAARISEFREGQ